MSNPSVHACYIEKMRLAAEKLRFQGSLPTHPTLSSSQVFTLEKDGVTLSLRMDETGFVVDARHSGSIGLLAGCLDQLCAELVHRPIQEGAEHALIRVERAFRSAVIAPPVLGLVTPANASLIFSLPQQLVRGIFRQYLSSRKEKASWNEWVEPLSQEWTDLSPAAKMEKAQNAVAKAIEAKSLPIARLDVLFIKHDRRITLAHSAYSIHPNFGHFLMEIEGEIKRTIDPALELVSESLEDKNHREERTKRDKTFGEDEKTVSPPAVP